MLIHVIISWLCACSYEVGLPGEDRQLGLDDLDPDDDEQQGADDEDDELQQSLQDCVRETVFTLQDLSHSVQHHGQSKLWMAKRRNNRSQVNFKVILKSN